MTPKLDIEQLRLTAATPAAGIRSQSRTRKFVKRVPVAWIVQVLQLKHGSACSVAIALRFVSGIQRSETVVLRRADRDLFGLLRWTVTRGLAHLEAAGLISVGRRRGRLPRVTLLEVP